MDLDVVERFAMIDGRLIRLETSTHGLEKWVTEESAPFHKRMNTFVDSFQATERERDRIQAQRHAENQESSRKTNLKLAVYGTLIALLGAVCAICMLILAVKAAQHAENDPAHIFHQNGQSQVYAQSQEYSGDPLAEQHEGR
jgi:hypothetical protein